MPASEPPYTPFLDRLSDVCSQLTGEAAVQGRRVAQICQSLHERIRKAGLLLPQDGDLALRRELGSLVELLARRTSQAIPLATAGRVALADLAGDQRFADQAAAECSQAILMLGL